MCDTKNIFFIFTRILYIFISENYSIHGYHLTNDILSTKMYSFWELVFTLIALINLCTCLVLYYKHKKQGDIKSFNAFKICMGMSLVFSTASVTMTLYNL